MGMSYADCITCERLLLRAKELIDEALWQHIYDEDNGERPDKNCAYSQWLNDCDRFLLGEDATT
jgi:hypothetical protein